MIVNHNNIQKWIFDYCEGNLSLHEQIELKDFIKRNPEYNKELESWEDARLQEDDVVPIYHNSQALIVAEKSLFQKSWKYAAAIILLAGSGLSYMLISGTQSSELSADMRGIEQDMVISPEYGINVINNLPNTTNYQQSQSGITPQLALQSEPITVPGISSPGAGPGSSWVSAIGDLQRINLRRVNPAIFEHAWSNGIPKIKNESIERDILYQKERVRKSIDFFLSKREKKRKFNSKPTAPDIVNKNGRNNKQMAHLRENSKLENAKGKQKRNKRHDRIFAREIGLTNLHDPIMIKDGESLLDLNPSFVGGLGTAKTRMLTSVRKRWAGSGHASVVSGVSADGYVDQLSGGIGFALSHMNYEDGMYEGYTASLSYAPRFELSRDVSLTIGTTVSVNQTRVDFDNYDYDSQVEIEKGTVYDTYSSGYTPRADKSITKDMALGVMLNTPFFFIGGSVDHVFESGQNLYNDDFATSYKVKRKYSVQVGGDYQKHASSEFSISPQLIFTNQAGKSELWVSSAVRCRKLIAGAGFSSSSSLKGIVGLQGKYLRLTYNYDLTKSELSNQLLGSHSASLRVLFFNKKKGSPLAFL